MKKILLIMCLQIVCTAGMLKAQTFTTVDTVWQTVPGTAVVNSLITNNTSNPITLKWHVVGTNFPNDWLADTAFGICDNVLCRGNASGALWNGSTGTTYTSANYAPGPGGAFDLSLNFTGTSTTGVYYVTVNLNDFLGGYSKNVTYMIGKYPAAVNNLNTADNNIVLYPNPAHDEVNIVYNASADIKTIAVYNIIGKVMTVYKAAGSSANMNIESMPAGIYFVRLMNGHGDVVATRKFTKQ